MALGPNKFLPTQLMISNYIPIQWKCAWIASIQNVCEFHHHFLCNSNNPMLFITEFSKFHTTFFILKHTHFQYSNLWTRVNSVRDFRVTMDVIHRKAFLSMPRTYLKLTNQRNRHQSMLWKLELRINNHISANPHCPQINSTAWYKHWKTELKLTHTISNQCDAQLHRFSSSNATTYSKTKT